MRRDAVRQQNRRVVIILVAVFVLLCSVALIRMLTR